MAAPFSWRLADAHAVASSATAASTVLPQARAVARDEFVIFM
jgi:hypothetical protein